MPRYEVTLVLGTTRTVEADSEDEAIDKVKNETQWCQCDIDRSDVEEIKGE